MENLKGWGGVAIEAFVIQHRKGGDRFERWYNRIRLAGAWGPIVEQCLKPVAAQRPTAQQALARVQSTLRRPDP